MPFEQRIGGAELGKHFFIKHGVNFRFEGESPPPIPTIGGICWREYIEMRQKYP